MSKWLIEGAYALFFTKTAVALLSGNECVGYATIKPQETELETAEKLIDKYMHNKLYTHYLKVLRIADNVKTPLKELRTDMTWYQFTQSYYVKNLLRLKKKLLDMSLNEMWVLENVDSKKS